MRPVTHKQYNGSQRRVTRQQRIRNASDRRHGVITIASGKRIKTRKKPPSMTSPRVLLGRTLMGITILMLPPLWVFPSTRYVMWYGVLNRPVK